MQSVGNAILYSMQIKWCFLKSMTLTVAAVFFFVSLSGFGGVVTNDYWSFLFVAMMPFVNN